MMQMDGAQWANVIASGLVALCAAVFAVTYHRLAPWRATSTGRHMMAFSTTIGVLGLYTCVITFLSPGGVAAVVLRVARVVILLTIAGLLLQRTRMVVAAQREDDSEESSDRTGV